MNPTNLIFVLLQIAGPTEGIWTWLLQQVPVVIVLGLVVYFQWEAIKQYKKDDKEKDIAHKADLATKDARINDLADKALTVASLYDVKSDLNSKEHDQILKVSGEIRDIVRDIKKN